MADFELIPADKKQKQVLEQLIELYLYDFSEYDNKDIDESGRYGYKYLDLYFKEKNRFPYFIKVRNKYAGFALLSTHCHILKSKEAKSISEYFIMKKIQKKRHRKICSHGNFRHVPRRLGDQTASAQCRSPGILEKSHNSIYK